MTDNELLQLAITLAVENHEGQTDKQGVPYILHPLRVMAKVQAAVGLKIPYLITAVLHDVVEDTPITLAHLKSLGFPTEILDAVDSVTKRDAENYISFVRRSKQNVIGRAVKLADVEDNQSRIPAKMNSKWWQKLSVKYAVAMAILKDDNTWLQDNSDLIVGMETA